MFDREDTSPVEVVVGALRRLEAEDYLGAAELYHPHFVAGRVVGASHSARPPHRRPTVEEIQRQDPDMPAEVARYWAEREANRPPPPPSFVEVYGVESEAELAALEPRELLARQLWAADHRWRFRQYLDDLAEKYPKYRRQLAEQKSSLSYQWHTHPLGHLEDEERAYVILGPQDPSLSGRRKEVPDDSLAAVVVLRRDGGSWRISSSLALARGDAHLHLAVQDDDGNTVVLS